MGAPYNGNSYRWTGSGHYVLATSWDGTYVNINDPASVSRTGKHKWSDLDGLVKVFYLIEKPKTSTSSSKSSNKTTSSSSKTVKAKVSAKSGLYLRKSNKKIITKLANGTTVTVVKKSATTMSINGVKYTMTKVKYGSKTGYVAQKYLKF